MYRKKCACGQRGDKEGCADVGVSVGAEDAGMGGSEKKKTWEQGGALARSATRSGEVRKDAHPVIIIDDDEELALGAWVALALAAGALGVTYIFQGLSACRQPAGHGTGVPPTHDRITHDQST
ncbi:hypothetical protein B0H10DRAFT_1972128 [Mycena sp. CBHHK59/15]|nr:hypothetical protein B0H10DRAFT_1972128 [Mycena sp. CBHHK59/15]